MSYFAVRREAGPAWAAGGIYDQPAVAGLATLAGPEREHELKTTIVDGLAPFRQADGSYRLSNEYHYLVARA